MHVGFIGLGNMGSGMAANLLKAGHTVTAYNRSAVKVNALVQLGATAAPTVADACRGEVVQTMLADDDAVESVTLGTGGIVASLPCPNATRGSESRSGQPSTTPRSPSGPKAGSSIDEKSGPRRSICPPSTLMTWPVM